MGEKGSRKHDGDGWRKGHSGLVRVPWSTLSWGCGGAGASLGWESREQLRPLLVAMVEPAQRELGAGTLQTLGTDSLEHWDKAQGHPESLGARSIPQTLSDLKSLGNLGT